MGRGIYIDRDAVRAAHPFVLYRHLFFFSFVSILCNVIYDVVVGVDYCGFRLFCVSVCIYDIHGRSIESRGILGG